jgi:four helix bundle protein
MGFKFEKLEVWQLALDYLDLVYGIADQLPASERFNLKAQIVSAATSAALNIAEGSTGQTDAEQARFLGIAIRSVIETVACLLLIGRRKLLQDVTPLRKAYAAAHSFVTKLQSMRRTFQPEKPWLRESPAAYEVGGDSTLDDLLDDEPFPSFE